METSNESLFAAILMGKQDFQALPSDTQRALTQWAIPQGMAALLYHHLKKQGVDEDDYDFGECLREQSQVQYVQYLQRMNAIGEVAETFEMAGIPLVFLKGFSVTHQVYELPHLRYMCDVDALVLPEDRERALALMQELEFHLCATPRLSYNNPLWIKYGHYYNFHLNGVDIDLRDMIYDTRALMKLNDEQNDWFTHQTHRVALKNGQMIHVLCPEVELLYTSAHAFYHHVNLPTYKSMVDIAYLCQSGQLNWQRVLDAAGRLDWQEGLYYMLQSSKAFFSMEIPEDVMDTLKTECRDENSSSFIRRLRKSYNIAGEIRSVEPRERFRFFWNLYILPDKAYMMENYPVRQSWQLTYYYLVYILSRFKPFLGILFRLRDR